MDQNGWEHADVMRISGQSSSVVSQWLGKGSKLIKSIGKVSAAVRLAEAAGVSAEWLADGTPPKYKPPPAAGAQPLRVDDHAAHYLTTAQLLAKMGEVLATVPEARREAVATNLAGWGRDGGAAHWQQALLVLLESAVTRGKHVA